VVKGRPASAGFSHSELRTPCGPRELGLSFMAASDGRSGPLSAVLERAAFDLELCLEPSASTRRFRWRLTDARNFELLSSDTYATRREAQKEGEIALGRARQRGRLRP
jgi:hypothetical protein